MLGKEISLVQNFLEIKRTKFVYFHPISNRNIQIVHYNPELF